MNATSLRRALPWCAIVLTILALFAVPQTARADVAPGSDPLFCAGVLCESVVFAATPNWKLGNPQPASVSYCSEIVGLCPGGTELYESLSELTARGVFGLTYVDALTPAAENGNTLAGLAAGIANPGTIAVDIAVQNALWVSPVEYTWLGGVAGGGLYARYNSLYLGHYYANELMILDPPGISLPALADEFDLLNGGNGILPSATSLGTLTSNTVPIPPPPPFNEAPEPSYFALMAGGAALFLLAAWKHRRPVRL
jgi:hypothetical protein